MREPGRLLWQPSPEQVEATRLAGYMRWLGETRGLAFDGYHDLWRWLVTDLEGFWGSLWEHFGVQASAPYERVLGARTLPGAEWFPGARLSYAEHVFRGECKGRIVRTPRGRHGFGYDPYFVPDGHDRTLAELSESEKNALSHRARAVAHFLSFLRASFS